MELFRDNETIIQIEHNMFKNPNWLEADQLAILQAQPNELVTTVNKSS